MADAPRVRVLEPHPSVMAYFCGRDGVRFAEGPNWVDDGALSLGIASYAVLSGEHALVYDTHVSIPHAHAVRRDLEKRGARHFTVVLSHWHLDHVAGTEVFADCEIIANARTAAHLARRQGAIEAGTSSGPPAIVPLVLPTRTFSGALSLRIGRLDVQLMEANIHSDDATVAWLPRSRILLAGDTLEDTVTYVAEPAHLAHHLPELDRLWELDPLHVLPNHGDPDVIAGGGYGKPLIRATQQYIRGLLRCAEDVEHRQLALRDFVAGPLRAGWIQYFEPYEAIHRQNVERAVAAAANKRA